MLLLLHLCIIIWLRNYECKSLSSLIAADAPQDGPPNNGNGDNTGEIDGGNVLNFLILSDWGKGGQNGDYWNSKDGSMSENDDEVGLTLFEGPPGGAGGPGNQKLYQKEVADAMANYASRLNPTPSFILACGDNFYTQGVNSVNDVSLVNHLR